MPIKFKATKCGEVESDIIDDMHLAEVLKSAYERHGYIVETAPEEGGEANVPSNRQVKG